jgi:hypothetical protein
MQVKQDVELSTIIDECLAELEDGEAALIRECHLQEPRTAFPIFAKKRRLSQKALSELRTRALDRMRDSLAARNIYSLGDIL